MMAARLSGSGALFVYTVTVGILVFVVAPLAVVVALSFSEANLAIFPPVGFTLSWYESVVADEEFRHAFVVSVVLALASTVASFVLGVPAAYALNRWPIPGARAVEAALLSPLILPILITGLALLQFMAAMRMRDAAVNLFIGHVLVTLPYLVRTVTVSLKQVDRSLEEAALTLGAPPWKVFWLVTVPQIVPGIAAGCLFAFMVSFDDFPISFWLGDAGTMPLPIFLHNSMNKVFDPSVAATSSLMILTGVLAVIGLEKLVGLRRAMSM
jgi:putative spermidine/putrescine transport system permease protein